MQKLVRAGWIGWVVMGGGVALGGPQGAPLDHLNQGARLHAEKKWGAALTEYNRVIQSGGELRAVAYFYKARLFAENGKLEYAKKLMAQVRFDELPGDIREKALIFNSQLNSDEYTRGQSPEKDSAEKRVALYFEASMGVNNNPAYSSALDWDRQTQLFANAYYKFWLSSTIDWRVNYSFQNVSYRDNVGSRYGFNGVSFPVSVYQESGRFRMVPDFTVDTYGGVGFSRIFSDVFEYTYKWDVLYVSLYYQYFKMWVIDRTYDYLNGSAHRPKVEFKKAWKNSIFSLNFKYDKYNYSDSTTIASSYRALGGGASYYRTIEAWDFTGGLSYEKRTYSVAASDSFAREDKKLNIAFQLGYVLSPHFRVFIDTGYTRNISNFDSSSGDYSYSQISSMGGISAGI